MIDAISYILAFVVAISVLVAVHEYGHYIVGRWCGMKVLRFSIGFGKPVLMRRGAAPDHTEYCVSAVPLGGYVRFLDSREGAVTPQDAGRAFDQRPIPARIAVLLAGPVFNFLFAIAAYWALFVYGQPEVQPAVGYVTPGSIAAEAGLRNGDRIVRVDDVDTADWETTLITMLDRLVSDGQVSLTLDDGDGNRRVAALDAGADVTRLTEPGVLFDGLGFRPWAPPADVGSLVAGGAAEVSGLRVGDRIAAIDDEPMHSFFDIPRAILERPGETAVLEVERDGATVEMTVRIGSDVRDGKTVGVLGIGSRADYGDLRYQRQYGLLEAVPRAIARTWQSSAFTVHMLGRMLTGEVSIKNISGPINIAQYAGESAQAGVDRFLSFLAIVSISLGVLNLIPLPILDGGQIVYQLIEAAKGSPLSERAQILGQQVGIFALILIMSFAFYNDIARILG